MFSDDFGAAMVDTPVLSAGFITAIRIQILERKAESSTLNSTHWKKANHYIAWKKQQEEHQNIFSSEILRNSIDTLMYFWLEEET